MAKADYRTKASECCRSTWLKLARLSPFVEPTREAAMAAFAKSWRRK